MCSCGTTKYASDRFCRKCGKQNTGEAPILSSSSSVLTMSSTLPQTTTSRCTTAEAFQALPSATLPAHSDRGLSCRLDSLFDEMDKSLRHVQTPENPLLQDRGLCYFCKQQIQGQRFRANGKLFHPHHFACHHCKRNLINAPFRWEGEQPVCTGCVTAFLPECAHCMQKIQGESVTALGQS